jgi:Domain of unknown function (DUF4258)
VRKSFHPDTAETPTTVHAQERMQHRCIDPEAVRAALDFGREVFTRGAIVHAIGRREIERWSDEGVDLSSYDGVQVVCSHDGAVLTVYRNRNFRGLRPGLGRRGYTTTTIRQSL